jgi:hypothetical protein
MLCGSRDLMSFPEVPYLFINRLLAQVVGTPTRGFQDLVGKPLVGVRRDRTGFIPVPTGRDAGKRFKALFCLKEKKMTVKIDRLARFTSLIALTGVLLFPALRPSLAEGSGAGSGGATPPCPTIIVITSTYIYYSDGTVLFSDGYVLAPDQNSDPYGGHVRPIL